MNDKYGFVNKMGEIVIPCQFDDNYTFIKEIACVKMDGKWGFISCKRTSIRIKLNSDLFLERGVMYGIINTKS